MIVQMYKLKYCNIHTNQSHSARKAKRKFIQKINGLFLLLIVSASRGHGNDTFHKFFKNHCISKKSRLNSLFSIEVIVIPRFPSPIPSPQHPCPPIVTANLKSYRKIFNLIQKIKQISRANLENRKFCLLKKTASCSSNYKPK